MKKKMTFLICPKSSGTIKIPKLPKTSQASWKRKIPGISLECQKNLATWAEDS
jgi:hypothetical protein